MNTEKILNLVKELFDDEITTWTAETAFGTQSGIDGKIEFFKRLKEELEKED
jgi:hypothetical protein